MNTPSPVSDPWRKVDARPRIDIDPVAQAEAPCSKCGMTAWKREYRHQDGNESYTRRESDGVVTDRTWFEPYEYLRWTCWPCGWSFETNTLEDYAKDQQAMA